MNQQLKPARVFPPGRVLSEELEARGWTQKDLAEIIGRPPQTINEIIRGSKQITPETAIELSQALGTSPEFWTNLEARYRLDLAKKEKDDRDIARKSYLYSIAPVSELIKHQWIKTTESLDDLEQQVCTFFGISTLEELPQLAVNFRCAEHRDPVMTSRMAWVKQVENLALRQTVASFDRARLLDSISDILACSKQVENVAQIPELVKNLGVHFLIVPHLSKTYLDGAALYLNDNPVVALTLRYDRIDSFWFTLMHELAHIIAGHQGSFLDNFDHLEVNDEETEASQLAADWLIDSQALQDFVTGTKKHFSRKAIENFARTQQRHPGIILGRLQRSNLVPYKNLRHLLVKVSPFLRDGIDMSVK